ncbi:MAG TPA: hypothetical protein VI818_03010 [Candidatus Thermoplasmatota archaeon]|nr:hypothetical protein [Candidatus Thermoplasmatota archaeon]
MAFTWVELVRVIHVLAAVVWVGGAVFGLVMVAPNVKAAGEAGQRFMQTVMRRGGFGRLMGPAGATTIVAGVILYWQNGLWREPFATPAASALTIAGGLAIVAFAAGLGYGMPMQKRMAAMGKAVGPGGATPEQSAAMARLGGRLAKFGAMFVWTLVLVLVLMVGRNLF